MRLCRQTALLYNRAMHTSWKADRRRTLWITTLGIALWALLIYWQGEVSWLGIRQAFGSLLALDFQAISTPYDSLLLDSFLFLFTGFFWALFFAHYVLPIRHPEELAKVLTEMGRGLLGMRPEALILHNGQPVVYRREGRPRKPRIFLLDSASAAVLRNAKAYTRAIGPGLSFTSGDEELAGTLDLRIQRRSLGPLPDEDPFSLQLQGEELVSFRARQERRKETSALTRDGVEIVARIEVDFRVEGRSGKNGSPYTFQAEFAWRALAHEGIAPQSPSDTHAHQASWDWLPVHLATELWREYLGKISVHELFDAENASNGTDAKLEGLTGLEQLEKMINTRLTRAIAPESFRSKKSVERNISSPEYQLLRSRGLRAHSVRMRELHLDPLRDETRLVNEWSEAWEIRAIQTSVKASQRNEEKERQGQQSAAAEFVRLVSSQLYKRLKEADGKRVAPPNKDESLDLLIRGSLQGVSRVPGLDPDVGERMQWLAALLLNGGDDAAS